MKEIRDVKEKLYNKLREYKVDSLDEVVSFDSEARIIIDDVNRSILKHKGVASLEELRCPVCKKSLSNETVSKWEHLLTYRLDAFGELWCKTCTDIHDSIDWDKV
jgi:uncharacterized protein YbaR (Trm112 family)